MSSGLKIRIYADVKDAILSRELIPGDIISERELGRTFGVSRIPVREALKRLEAEGWVVVLPRRGTQIRGLEVSDIHEIFQLREQLEPLAAQLASQAMTPATDARFRRVLAAMERSTARQDPEAFVRQDLTVHTLIARLSGNSRLETAIVGLGENIRRLGTHSVSVPGRLRVSLEEHQELARALLARSGVEARHRMLTHLVNSRDTILTLVAYGDRHSSPGALGVLTRDTNRPLRYRNKRHIRAERRQKR